MRQCRYQCCFVIWGTVFSLLFLTMLGGVIFVALMDTCVYDPTGVFKCDSPDYECTVLNGTLPCANVTCSLNQKFYNCSTYKDPPLQCPCYSAFNITVDPVPDDQQPFGRSLFFFFFLQTMI